MPDRHLQSPSAANWFARSNRTNESRTAVVPGNSVTKAPRSKSPNVVEKPKKPIRSFSIRNGSLSTWQLQPTSNPEIDVETREFPCELVRKAEACAIHSNDKGIDSPFVNNFDDAYLLVVSASLRQLDPSDGIRVTATLGRLLHSPINRNTHREMKWDQLQWLR